MEIGRSSSSGVGSTSATSASSVASGGVSDGMRALLDGYKRLHESVLKVQAQIEDEEAAYLEDTPHGNIIRGWDGFIDAKQPRKDGALKKVKPYTESEHLFSSCCLYSTLATEPTLDLIDPTAVVHDTSTSSTSSRRKLSATGAASATSALPSSIALVRASSTTAAMAGGGLTTGTPVAPSNSSKLQRSQSMSERKGSFGSMAVGKGGGHSTSTSNSMSVTGKASKLKKRKREKLESVDSADLEDDGAAVAVATAAGVPRITVPLTALDVGGGADGGVSLARDSTPVVVSTATASTPTEKDILDIF